LRRIKAGGGYDQIIADDLAGRYGKPKSRNAAKGQRGSPRRVGRRTQH
jgi:hypothetical protein